MMDHSYEQPIIQRIGLIDIAGHWARDNINELVATGAVGGYPDSSFKPDRTITRAEFATILVKAFKIESGEGKIFGDTASHWARESIAAAAAAGVVNGYPDNTFKPDSQITREQMAVMTAKAAHLEQISPDTTFVDSQNISPWAREAIAMVVKAGIATGYPNHTFQPKGKATRAEAVTMIVKAL